MTKITYKQALEAFNNNNERTKHSKNQDKLYKKQNPKMILDENDERGSEFLTSKGQQKYDFKDVDYGNYFKKHQQSILNAVRDIIDENTKKGKATKIRIISDKLGKYTEKIRAKVEENKKPYDYAEQTNLFNESLKKVKEQLIKEVVVKMKKKIKNIIENDINQCCYINQGIHIPSNIITMKELKGVELKELIDCENKQRKESYFCKEHNKYQYEFINQIIEETKRDKEYQYKRYDRYLLSNKKITFQEWVKEDAQIKIRENESEQRIADKAQRKRELIDVIDNTREKYLKATSDESKSKYKKRFYEKVKEYNSIDSLIYEYTINGKKK